ncbi:methyl-accepting chemotaxis protein [Pseudomonas indica]|nr:methyl-accepting chemotaxis protein [Pseudomonas indica]PAU63439.1 methyl-accepting chemotaxis protein [Pseudomonas indica]
MLRSASRVFADLAVGKKLLSGFALVLLLTIAVAGTGFYAVNAILERFSHNALLAEVDVEIAQARRFEKDFALTAKAESAQQVRERLATVRERLEQLRKTTSAGNRERVQRMDDASAGYLDQFERFVKLFDEARAARITMGEAAAEARDQFEVIELDMYDAVRELRLQGDRLRGSDPLTLAETASGLSKRMLDLRGNESLYIIDGSEEALKTWAEVYDDLKSVASSLKVWLDDDQKRSIDTALVALDSYQKAFDNYHRLRVESRTSEAAMVEQARAVIGLVDEAQANEQAEMLGERRQVYALLGGMSLGAVLLGLCAALLISRLIVGPLRETVAFVQRVAQGDLTHDLRMERRDELGQLMSAMQSMTVSLRTLVGRIGGSVGQIASAAEQLSAITAQTSQGVQTQKLETEQTATAMHEMAATVQEVARNAEQASLAARDADREAQQGDQVVREAVGQVGRLADEVEHSAEALQQLHQESSRIGSVLEVIRNVAEQTNLLALNAAIEAARAGEQGRGFAVVADEVRALARRTHDSTQEIETLIGTLQQMAHQAVEQMDASRSLTQRTVDLAGQAGAALGRITQAVSTIEQMNQQIAAAAEEQSAVAEAINESVTRVRDIGEQSASASEQTAASSAELARLGIELQGLVGQFRT